MNMETTLAAKILPPILKEAAAHGATPGELVDVFVASLRDAFPARPAETQTASFLAAGRAGRLKLLAAEGGCVDSKTAAQLYAGTPGKTSPETVRKAAREHRIVAIRDGHNDLLFPVWQFADGGRVLPGLTQVLGLLRESPGYSEITPFRFFLQKHPRTGVTPLEALRNGDVEAAVDAAAADRD